MSKKPLKCTKTCPGSLICKFRYVHVELSQQGPPVFQLSLDIFFPSTMHQSGKSFFFFKECIENNNITSLSENPFTMLKNDSPFEHGIEIYFPPTSLQGKI